jgi:transposase
MKYLRPFVRQLADRLSLNLITSLNAIGSRECPLIAITNQPKENYAMTYETLFVGIDISKLKHDVAIMNENKQLVCKPFIVTESRAGYEYFVSRLEQLQTKHQTQTFIIGMEATSDYWKNLYHCLNRQSGDVSVVVINPVKTKAFAKAELRRAKTDPVNAKDIAQYLVEKRPQPSIARPQLWDNIKDLDTQIRALNKQQTMNINKLRIELGKVAPELEQHFKIIAGKKILTLLEKFPTAELIATASIEQLCEIRYGTKQWSLPITFVNQIKTLAQHSIAHKTGPGAGLVVQSLVNNIFHFQQQIQFLKEQMKQLYDQITDNDSLLISIPGISQETAIVLEAYFGDVSRFPDAKKFVAFFGMNPTINLSGTKKKSMSYLEKKGSGVVRHKLYMATINMIRRRVEPIYSYYQRLVAKGKPRLVAIGAAMRKLLVMMYAMLKNKQKFDPKKFVDF